MGNYGNGEKNFVSIFVSILCCKQRLKAPNFGRVRQKAEKEKVRKPLKTKGKIPKPLRLRDFPFGGEEGIRTLQKELKTVGNQRLSIFVSIFVSIFGRVSAVNENGRRRGVIKRGHGVLIAVGVLLADVRVYFPHGLRIRPAADLHGHLFRHVDVFSKRSEAVPEAMETDAGQIVREADSVDPFSDGFRVERDHGSAWGRFTLTFGQKLIKAVHHNGDIAAGGAVFGLRL